MIAAGGGGHEMDPLRLRVSEQLTVYEVYCEETGVGEFVAAAWMVQAPSVPS